jgi:hypothetical protein
VLARGILDRAIGACLKGSEADWRDAYPGVNAVMLMELKEPPDPRRAPRPGPTESRRLLGRARPRT